MWDKRKDDYISREKHERWERLERPFYVHEEKSQMDEEQEGAEVIGRGRFNITEERLLVVLWLQFTIIAVLVGLNGGTFTESFIISLVTTTFLFMVLCWPGE